jgi:hypothetical protein
LANSKRVIEPSSKHAIQQVNRSFELLEPLPEKAQKIADLGTDGVAKLLCKKQDSFAISGDDEVRVCLIANTHIGI